MTELTVKAYYQYDGPCREDLWPNELPDDDVIRNLRLLPSDFSHALDESATIEVIREDYDHKEIEIRIRANCTREELHAVAKSLLSKAGLYWKV